MNGTGGWPGVHYKFGGVKTEDLDKLFERAQRELVEWCQGMEKERVIGEDLRHKIRCGSDGS